MAKKKGNKPGKSKGFGEAPAAPKKQSSNAEIATETFTPMATTPEATQIDGTQALPNTQFDTARAEDRPGTSDMNEGQKLLAQMRREQAEKKDAELRKVRDIRSTDQMLQESPEAAAIPEKVAQRMGKRMLPFVGIPLFGSLGAFVAFWYFATYKEMEFQPGAVATTTIVILVSGLLVSVSCGCVLMYFDLFSYSAPCCQGITYSIVSASWDEDREGSALGFDEFQKNVGNIKEGLDRSKENTLLREKMAGLPTAEIEAAIADMERREKRQQQSFQAKMEELEE